MAEPPGLAPNVPTAAEVQRIVDETDPVVRNLQITQLYYEVSQAFVQRFAPRSTWCTFATWASRQAGVSIRREDLGRAFEQLLKEDSQIGRSVGRIVTLLLHLRPKDADSSLLETLVHEALSPQAAVARVAQPISDGNLKVFDEIGRAFCRFLALFTGNRIAERPLNELLATFRPGDSPVGQTYLVRAFAHYAQALEADVPKDRDEKLLLANLEVGFHEQTRLQPEIETALGAPLIDPHDLAERLIDRVLPGGQRVAHLVMGALRPVRTPLVEACNGLVELLRDRVRQVITKTLMGVRLPDRRLRLGQDLEKEYPDTLREIRNPELRALLKRLDPTPDSFLETGAENWSNLADRVHYIADYFRAYHHHPPMLHAPYSPQQVREIKQGRIPQGRL